MLKKLFPLLLLVSMTAGAQTCTDGFTGTAGTTLASPPWTETQGNMKYTASCSGGTPCAYDGTGDATSVYTNCGVGNDHYSQAQVIQTPGGISGVSVRASNTTKARYIWAPTLTSSIYIIDASGSGVGAISMSVSCPSVTAGDTIKLSVAGTAFTCTNVTSGLSGAGTDSTYSTGYPGISTVIGSQETAFQTGIVASSVADPVPSPNGSTFVGSQNVTATDATSGATICYTTDGSTPTASGGSCTHGSAYSTTLNFTVTTTLKLLGTKSGLANSNVVTAVFTLHTPTTYYIRLDGGTNVQCDGKTNHALAGATGTNCAFNHPYQMMNSSGAWSAFTTSDSIVFADANTNTTPYYMGEQNNGLGTDWHSQLASICPAANSGYAGGSTTCILPALPNNVTVTGQNAGACHTPTHTGLDHPTILSGIAGAFTVLNLQGTTGVTLNCIEITQPDTCTRIGTLANCNTTTGNWVWGGGLNFDYNGKGPNQFTLTDVGMYGLANTGIQGSYINSSTSDVSTINDLYLEGNGEAGWNADNGTGSCSSSCESVGTLNAHYGRVEGNGCILVKPFDVSKKLTDNGFTDCVSQNDGGNGDGWVFIASGQFTANIDHFAFDYNVQDGLDALHISDDPAHLVSINVSASEAIGNSGQQFKEGVGDNATSTLTTSYSSSNCRVLTSGTFPNNPGGWQRPNAADDCRAAGGHYAFSLANGSHVVLENNTAVGYAATRYQIVCGGTEPNCVTSGGATIVWKNNLELGFGDPGNSGALPGLFDYGAGNPFSNAGSAAAYNLLWNLKASEGCPSSTVPSGTNWICSDPLLTSQASYNAVVPTLSSVSSPAYHAGTHISAIISDFVGNIYNNPPSLGAYEFLVRSPIIFGSGVKAGSGILVLGQ